jgi:Ca-activated chloride channel family protein
MARNLHVRPDRMLIRADGSSRRQRHLRVEVVAPRRPPRTPLSLGLVLDRSGSMGGAKLELARQGAIHAIRSLRAHDRVSVVAYNEDVQVLVRSGTADDPAKRVAEHRLRQLAAGGNTDLCGGWLRGCEQVGLGLDDGRLGRCLLLTDGLANEGITDPSTIVGHATELRRRGVRTSTLGVGRDFDEVLLREMAEAGGGSFYFAENPAQLTDFIAGETGEALKVAVRDALLVVDLPSEASLLSVNPFRVRSEQNRSVVEIGDLVADQVLSLVLAIDFPERREGEAVPVQCWLWDPDGVLEGSVDLTFRYANPSAYAAERRDREVDREAMSAYAAAARRRAAELGREGKTDEGRAVLRKMAGDIRRHAQGDARLVALAADLEQEAAGLERMDSLDYKRLEYTTFGALRSRGVDGMTIGTLSFTSQALAATMRGEHCGGGRASILVTAVTTDKHDTRLVERAGHALAAAHPRAFAYSVVDGGARILDPGTGDELSRDDELGLVYAMAGAGDGVKIAFVRGTLDGGAACHCHVKDKAAIVSLSAWSDTSSVPAEAFVACEMVVQGLRQQWPAWDPTSPIHRDSRKCWFSFDETQAGIESRIRAGDLCAECRKHLAAAGLHVDELLSLVAAVQQLGEQPAGTAD